VADILTAKEAADYLKIHVKTTCRLARQGKIPGSKIGGKWRFLKSDLTAWVHGNNPANNPGSED